MLSRREECVYTAPSQCSLPHPHSEFMRVSLEKRLLGKVEMLVHHQVLLKYFVYVLTQCWGGSNSLSFCFREMIFKSAFLHLWG